MGVNPEISRTYRDFERHGTVNKFGVNSLADFHSKSRYASRRLLTSPGSRGVRNAGLNRVHILKLLEKERSGVFKKCASIP